MNSSSLIKIICLVFIMTLAASACGQAPGEIVDSVNVEGNYNIAGTNPDGSEYGCMLDITKNGDVYDWYWFACGDYEGTGIQQGEMISVAWGSSDCAIYSYEILADGSLEAIWTPMEYTNLGTERAIPQQADGTTLEGMYAVTGKNPDGSKYEGTLEVIVNGDVYDWRWDVGGEFQGTGIRRENTVSVAYGGAGCSVMSYLVHEDKTLDSLWAYVGATDLGTETVTPLNADATETAGQNNEPQVGEVGQNASDAPARPSAGCGNEPPSFPGATATMNIEVNGLKRVYLLHLPTNYDRNKPTSLVLAFHGYTDSAGGMEGTGLSYHADEYNYIVVYPHATHFLGDSGYITSWNDLTCNASPGPEGPICSEDATKYPFPADCGDNVSKECNWCTCNDDLGYVEQVLDELEQNLCIDLNRVYATGMSNGGMFVNRLGCDMADRFAAIAPVSGTLARGFNCAPDSSNQTSIMYIHGRDDDYVDVTGKESTDGYFYTPVEDVMALWASPESQNCSEEVTPYPTIADNIRGMQCTQHKDCETGAEIVSCWWDAGHAWPGGNTPFGNDMIWDFFLKNPKNIQP